MKTCAICTLTNDDAAPTCPACGEASWLTSGPVPAAPPVAESPIEPEPAPKRGRK